jgi:hypothetical protein
MPLSYVYNTLAKTSKGKIMHFNVVIDEPHQQTALNCAKAWLKDTGHEGATVTPENCYFCHSLEAPKALRQQIDAQGYAIYPLAGCPT